MLIELIAILWILGAFAYAGDKASEYFDNKGGFLTLAVLAVNFVGMPVIVAMKKFEMLPDNHWF